MENKERLTLRIHRGWSKKPPAALTSVLLAKHGCPPGLGPALAGLAGRDIVTRIKSTTSAAVTGGDVENRRLDLPEITVTAAAASTIVTDCDLPKRRTGSTLSTQTNAPAAAIAVRQVSNHGKKNNRSHRGHRCLGPGPRNGGLGLANGDDGLDPSGSYNSSIWRAILYMRKRWLTDFYICGRVSASTF